MTNADKALDYVTPGMTVGLGSGRAAQRFIRALAERKLHVRCIATSKATSDLAASLGLELATLDQVSHIDLTVDGADEVDPNLNLIKGYGRALVREKIVAAASRHVVILVGPESVREKLVPVLGTRGKLPVEVLAFGLPVCRGKLEEMGIASTPIDRHTTANSLFRTMATRSSIVAWDRLPTRQNWNARFARSPGWLAPGCSLAWPTR